jgi:hypothetical protein
MKRLIAPFLVVLALMVGASGAAAQSSGNAEARTQSASCAGAVSWQRARANVGRVVTVKGRVVGALYASSSNGSPTFLDIGADYPSPRRLTVVIWIENRGRFTAPERRYRGHTICIRGLVDTYEGVAQIEARSPSQIFVAR